MTLAPYVSAPLAAVELPADRHPALVYLASLGSERSRRTQRQALDTIANLMTNNQLNHRSFPWHALRYQHTSAVRSTLQERYAPATANKMLAALRRVIGEARRLGLMTADEAQGAADVRSIRSSTLPRGRALSSGELAALIGACQDGTMAGARDAAIVAVAYATGMRRSELVALDLAHYEESSGALIVHGKGRKDRTVYLEEGARAALADWLVVRGSEAGPIFYAIDKADRVITRRTNKQGAETYGRMSDQAILDILRRRGAAAGVRAFSPHDLRRTCISDLLDAGADIATVQRLAGHADPATTSRYDRRGEAAKKKAAALLHVPYRRRRD